MSVSAALTRGFSLSRLEAVGLPIVLALTLGLTIVGLVCTVNAVGWTGKTFPGFLLNERLVVSGVGHYEWTGPKAGLKYPDKLLEVQGAPVSTMEQLLDRLAAEPVGTPTGYTVERRGERRTVTVRTMEFNWRDLIATFGVTAFASLFYLSIGLIVFILKRNTLVSWVFLGVCYVLSLYSVLIFDISAVHSGFIQLYLIANVLLPACFVHFGLHFPSPSRLVQRWPWIQTLPYGLALVLIIPILALYPDDSFVRYWYGVLAYMIVGAFAIILPVLREVRRPSSMLARQRARVVLFGAALAFPVPAIVFFAQSYFGSLYGVRINSNFLELPLLVFPAAIAYSIVKHNLFDVDVYIKRTVGYVLMTGVVAIGYFVIQSVSTTYVLEPMLGENAQRVYPLVFALLVVFLFNPVNARVQGIVDRVFFRKQFDYKETVLAVEEALASVLNFDEIADRILDTIREQMFIDSAGVVLLQDVDQPCLPIFVSEEVKGRLEPSSELCIEPKEPLMELIDRERTFVTKYDIAEDTAYRDIRAACTHRFDSVAASIGFPMVAHERLVGVLFVGDKKSGKFYSREDIDLLQTLSSHGATALENTRLVEQMKKEATTRANLARYLSPQIVEQVAKHDVELNLGGQRKAVTILFSDIRDFTTLSETWPPDQLIAILNEYLTDMVSVVFDHKGTIDKFVGDAIVAVFGSLIDVDNPAQNAVNAAIEMMRLMPALNARWEKTHGVNMGMGVGITTGEVFLGNIGSPQRMEFTVIGDTVNVASRFSGLARAGQILVSAETITQLEDGVEYNELPKMKVKGKAEDMQVFEIIYPVDRSSSPESN